MIKKRDDDRQWCTVFKKSDGGLRLLKVHGRGTECREKARNHARMFVFGAKAVLLWPREIDRMRRKIR